MRAWIATLLLAGACCSVAAAPEVFVGRVVAMLDAPSSRFDFTLQTRWGQVLLGKFPDASGDVSELSNGRRQVRLQLQTASLEIVDHPRYARFARGPRFFDAERFPEVTFLSEPYDAALLQSGGELPGRLRMHGIERREKFVLSAAQCKHPGRDCYIIARGAVRRSDYDLDGWSMAMRDEVRFTLRVRLRETGGR